MCATKDFLERLFVIFIVIPLGIIAFVAITGSAVKIGIELANLFLSLFGIEGLK
jgi:hypothetical protein